MKAAGADIPDDARLSEAPRHELAALLEEAIAESLEGETRVDPAHWRRALVEPALEFVARPAKQLRARLVGSAWTLAGGQGEAPTQLSLAIELLHAGSLIVDDIEDGSQMRRGQPALHRAWGLPTALNTGNWLYFLALEMLGRTGFEQAAAPADRSALRTLLRCHHGQALDVSVRVCDLRPAEVHGVVATITSLKTASLTELAAGLAAGAAGAGARAVSALSRFGHELGVYLQMLDDLTGVIAAARREKGAEDLALSRATWPWAWLAEDLDAATFAELQERARDVREGARPEALLDALGREVEGRGRAAARARIEPAIGAVRDALGGSAALDAIEADIRGWEVEFGA